jgi:hypothetical protein
MTEENKVLERTLKAGFKAILTVLMQIRDKKEGEPTNPITSDASKLFSRFYGE